MNLKRVLFVARFEKRYPFFPLMSRIDRVPRMAESSVPKSRSIMIQPRSPFLAIQIRVSPCLSPMTLCRISSKHMEMVSCHGRYHHHHHLFPWLPEWVCCFVVWVEERTNPPTHHLNPCSFGATRGVPFANLFEKSCASWRLNSRKYRAQEAVPIDKYCWKKPDGSKSLTLWIRTRACPCLNQKLLQSTCRSNTELNHHPSSIFESENVIR